MTENGQEQIILKYLFKGYSPPDSLAALDVTCAAYSRGACIITDVNLVAIRARLEERDYKLRGVEHQNSTWREMWVEQPESTAAHTAQV